MSANPNDPAAVTDAFRAAAESEANSRISAGTLFRTPDLAALESALATVRELGFGYVGFDLPTLCRWTDAVVLLAREFVRLDTGELVRVRDCDKYAGSLVPELCRQCGGKGITLETLLPEVRT